MLKQGLRSGIADIKSFIHVVRGQRVIMDSDLARIYGGTTARLNQQVGRNHHRFPEDFMFRLTRDEFDSLRLQIATSKNTRGGRRTLPRMFTEYGALMAANMLNSRRAIRMSVFVVRAFVKMREVLAANKALAEKLSELENKLTSRLDDHDKAIVYILNEIKRLMGPALIPAPKKRPIGFRREE